MNSVGSVCGTFSSMLHSAIISFDDHQSTTLQNHPQGYHDPSGLDDFHHWSKPYEHVKANCHWSLSIGIGWTANGQAYGEFHCCALVHVDALPPVCYQYIYWIAKLHAETYDIYWGESFHGPGIHTEWRDASAWDLFATAGQSPEYPIWMCMLACWHWIQICLSQVLVVRYL